MAKAQKTIMIPDDLYRLFAMQEQRTGVTFTRQAIAAFCSYFFTTHNGPDPVWVEAAVALENGDLSVSELPSHVARAKADRAHTIATQARKRQARDRYSPFSPEDMDREAGAMETDALAWERANEHTTDPIDSFFREFAQYQRQVAEHLHPPTPTED